MAVLYLANPYGCGNFDLYPSHFGAKKAEINQKVDNVTFESFKKETTTELDCKLNKDAFFRAEKNYESIDKRISEVEQSAIKSNLKYVESFGAIQTDLSWIRRELDNQRKENKGK